MAHMSGLAQIREWGWPAALGLFLLLAVMMAVVRGRGGPPIPGPSRLFGAKSRFRKQPGRASKPGRRRR